MDAGLAAPRRGVRRRRLHLVFRNLVPIRVRVVRVVLGGPLDPAAPQGAGLHVRGRMLVAHQPPDAPAIGEVVNRVLHDVPPQGEERPQGGRRCSAVSRAPTSKHSWSAASTMRCPVTRICSVSNGMLEGCDSHHVVPGFLPAVILPKASAEVRQAPPPDDHHRKASVPTNAALGNVRAQQYNPRPVVGWSLPVLPDDALEPLRGRTVCIVGNGPLEETVAPNRIDGHDAVVRFNRHPPVPGAGTRTTLHVTNLRPETAAAVAAAVADDIPIATASVGGDRPAVRWDGLAAQLETVLGCPPSSGLVAIAAAILARPLHLTIVGMDLAPRFSWVGRPPKPGPSLYHNWIGERRVFAWLMRKGQALGVPITLPSALSEALPGSAGQAPDPELLDRLLEARVGDTLETLRAQGRTPGGMEVFRRVAATLTTTLSDDYRVVLADPRSVALANLVRHLERYLFLPRERGVRDHPWWLYDPRCAELLERTATALRRATRAYAWMEPPGLEEALQVRFGAGPLMLMGVGVEGPVLTDYRHVFKCLTDPENWRPHEHTLRATVGIRSDGALPDVTAVTAVGDVLVVVSRYEAYRRFEFDATEEDWRTFIGGLRVAGLCTRNIKPSNLVWVAGRLRFVDVGNSLVPWSPLHARQMAKRAFLTHRFGPRSDLRVLMQATIANEDHPALVDFEPFCSAIGLVDQQSVDEAPPPVHPRASGPPYSLLIKLCAMDHELGPDFVQHLARLRRGGNVDEVVVVVDSRAGGFPRAFATPNRHRLLAGLRTLLERKVVDRVLEVPDDDRAVRATYATWFGVAATEKTPDTHADNGQQLFATLFGIDACRNDRILALDGDMLAWLGDTGVSWQARIDAAFVEVRDAVFVSPPICRSRAAAITMADARGPYRPCPRASAIARERLRALLPLATPPDSANRLPPWHRRLHGTAAVVRLHDADWGLIHVPNHPCKENPGRVLEILDRVEQGYIPAEQLDSHELVWDADWDGPTRNEPYVFVVAGRDVPSQKVRRCLDSMRRQRGPAWGAVLIDDASSAPLFEGLRDPRFTVVRNRRRRGYLPNLVRALRGFMGCPDSVAVLLDLDDCLVGDRVLERLEREYRDGADLTVGSMFRTDKPWRWPPDLRCPRHRRSNVWQHLRTFRRRLFDRLPLHALRRDDGTWFDVATDWAFMVPLVELSSSPRYIADVLYYYDCAGKSDACRAETAAAIDDILRRPPLVVPLGGPAR